MARTQFTRAAAPGATPASIEKAAVEQITAHQRLEAWGEAVGDAALSALSVLHQDVGRIVEALRPQAEAHIELLAWWAEAGRPQAGALLNKGNTAEAKKAARVHDTFTEFNGLRRFRTAVTGSRDRIDWDRVAWRNPEHVREITAGGKIIATAEDMAAVIRQGGQLWWPTPTDALTLIEHLDEQARAEAERERQRTRGGMVAFG